MELSAVQGLQVVANQAFAWKALPVFRSSHCYKIVSYFKAVWLISVFKS